MSLHTFTLLHTAISIIELLLGVMVVLQLIRGVLSWLTGAFLAFAALTSLTGFLFPFHGITPGDKLGVLSLLSAAIAALALYTFGLLRRWRLTFAIAIVITLYFDVFVAVAQAFEHVPSLHALAPTGTELPFAIAQGVVLIAFVLIGLKAVKSFRL